jgi:hypothetical protein
MVNPMNVYNESFLRYNYFILDTFHSDTLYFQNPSIIPAYYVALFIYVLG